MGEQARLFVIMRKQARLFAIVTTTRVIPVCFHFAHPRPDLTAPPLGRLSHRLTLPDPGPRKRRFVVFVDTWLTKRSLRFFAKNWLLRATILGSTALTCFRCERKVRLLCRIYFGLGWKRKNPSFPPFPCPSLARSLQRVSSPMCVMCAESAGDRGVYPVLGRRVHALR